jgi:hypothetical protein
MLQQQNLCPGNWVLLFCDEWKNIERGADIYLLAISDSALYEIDQHLQLEDELVLHLAGSVRMGCFKKGIR